MTKKILILIIMTFLLSGCSASVNLEIVDNKINESVSITAYQNAIYSKEILKTSFRNYIPAFSDDVIVDTMPDQEFPSIEYYQKKETDLGNGYLFNYKYTFDIDEYEDARSIKDGFKTYHISYDKFTNSLSLSTGDEIIYFNDYPTLEKIEINIKTDYVVKENNADRVNNNTYTWILKKDNSKNINMVIDMNNKKSTNIFDNNTIIIVGSIIAVIFIISLFLIIKNTINNKI